MQGESDRAQLIWGMSLGESLLTLLLVGVMVAMTMSNVDNILAKAAGTEALLLSMPAKVYWVERWANDGPREQSSMPADAPGLRDGGRYFRESDVGRADGAFTLEFNERFPGVEGRRVTLRAAIGPGEIPATLLWVCGRAAAPRGFAVRGENLTDTDDAHLPLPCRARS